MELLKERRLGEQVDALREKLHHVAEELRQQAAAEGERRVREAVGELRTELRGDLKEAKDRQEVTFFSKLKLNLLLRRRDGRAYERDTNT